ncbi:MAG: universal stress protein [Gammaproteobacteria bacterium]|nr:universal stress protein [Gammaproteobacteria bacterium]
MMNSYKQVLVAIDFTEDSQQVCQKALEIVGNNSSGKPVSILFLHVVEFVYQVSVAYEPMFYPAFEDLSKNEEELIKVSEQKMSKLIKELDRDGVFQIKSEVISGIPKTEILRLAEEKDIDLIVCGSHGRSGFELLLGSTANAVLHHAPCDVLAVRTKKE